MSNPKNHTKPLPKKPCRMSFDDYRYYADKVWEDISLDHLIQFIYLPPIEAKHDNLVNRRYQELLPRSIRDELTLYQQRKLLEHLYRYFKAPGGMAVETEEEIKDALQAIENLEFEGNFQSFTESFKAFQREHPSSYAILQRKFKRHEMLFLFLGRASAARFCKKNFGGAPLTFTPRTSTSRAAGSGNSNGTDEAYD